VAPLVFKTSLGIVRSPEGSTPSLLRQLKGKCWKDEKRKSYFINAGRLYCHLLKHPRCLRRLYWSCPATAEKGCRHKA